MTATLPRRACTLSAARSARRRVLRFTFTVYPRGVGPKATPPPVQCGMRIDPARARPVPFWRHGFAPPPLTSPRVRVDAVPRRRASCSARTASYTIAL